jgi:AcrR family transcriptional regulator
MRMPRWDPRAEDRLRDAALDLYLEHGYENVTVAQITARAGLTRRTFSRYFADKRDVLFAGSEQLPVALGDAVVSADDALSPFAALLAALMEVGDLLTDRVPHAAQRRAVIQASPELRERERTKYAAVTDALSNALQQRGTPESGARLLASVGVAVFQTAFERWTDQPERGDFPARVREAATELASSLGGYCASTVVLPSRSSSRTDMA